MRRIRSPSPPSSSRIGEPSFDDDWEYIAPARGASHQPAASGRADRAGGHPSYMNPYYAPDPGSSDGEAIPPPPYATYPGTRNARRNAEVDPGNSVGEAIPPPPYATYPDPRNARRLGEVHETARRHESRNTDVPREEHGSSRRQGSHNAAHSRANSWEPGTSRACGAGASPSASEHQSIDDFDADLRYMETLGLSEERRDMWVGAHNIVRSNQMHQQANLLPSGRRGGRYNMS